MPASAPAPESCANCGAEIPRAARSCPACGADERTGWRDVDPADGLDLPGGGEPAASDPRSVNGLAWYWWAAGVALLLLIGLAVLRLR